MNLSNGTITSPATDTNLTFDGCGNETSLLLNGNGGGTFAVDYLNEYTTFNGQALTSDSDGDVRTYNSWTYTYDAQNRLLSAALSGTTIATFYYDGLNRQVARSINGVITFSVWDGDWAVLEEYGTSNTITQKYLQGYHGLVKTLQNNIYYYQDELGSTSHIASANGALLEYYKYNLYGAPTYWSASGSQLQTSNTRDLFTGQRWIPELGLYDDRNRFMSPTLGRFIQPDPIGFKGDASNLYRYCGNDWANRTDSMGLADGIDPVDTIQFRNTLQDRVGVEKFQQMQQTIRAAQSVEVRGLNQQIGGHSEQKAINEKYENAPWGKESDLNGPHYMIVNDVKDAQKKVGTADEQIYNGHWQAMHDKDLFNKEHLTSPTGAQTETSNNDFRRADNGMVHDKLSARLKDGYKDQSVDQRTKQTNVVGWNSQRWHIQPQAFEHRDFIHYNPSTHTNSYDHWVYPIEW